MRQPPKPITDPLYVIAVISNPRRYWSRYGLYREFAKYIADSGAILYTVETAFGDRPFEVTEVDNPHHIQLRTPDELWIKENMMNIGLSRLPLDWKYCAFIDADVTFSRPDWVMECKQLLQHHPVIQMFSVAQDLSPSHEPFASYKGLIKTWIDTGFHSDHEGIPDNDSSYSKRFGHPGYCWAFTRYAMDTLGGVLETGLMGAGDFHMSLGLIGRESESFQPGITDNYKHAIHAWSRRAAKLEQNIGYMDGLLLHYWHGKKSTRGYVSRWKVLTEHQFDPYTDIYKDSQGLWRLTDGKPRMRMDMHLYLASRKEDDTSMD